jgi:hypothetical protein
LHEDEIISTFQLLDFAIDLKKDLSDLNQLAINFVHDDVTISLSYDFKNHFQFRESPEFKYLLEINGQNIGLLEYLNESPLQIYLDDFATIADHEFFASPQEGDYQYSAEKIALLDWGANNTDITKEFYENAQEKSGNGNKNSIHETLHLNLTAKNYDILIYDHGTGEVADFITIKEFADKIQISLYHVKGSTGSNPGDRVADVYEVCMQAVKSQVWTTNKNTFKNKILNRTMAHNEKFIVGDKDAFTALMNKGKRAEFIFYIVQPGISKTTFSPKLSYILAATDDSLINSGFEPLVAIGS